MTDSSVEAVARAIEEMPTHPPGGAREMVSRELVRKVLVAFAALPSPEREPMREALEDELHPAELAEIEEQQFTAAIHSAFRMGARGCREMMARFVETSPPTDPKVLAGSIRANWNPHWGDDFGAPDEYPVELGALEGRVDAEKFAASAVEHAMSLLAPPTAQSGDRT